MKEILYKNMVSLIGFLLIIIGCIAAFFGPLEIYSFYFFTEGGRFHYEGFGFGSFMFSNIVLQIIGYYLIAVVFITLGYGHFKKRLWVQKISLALLWFWLIVGLPIIPLILFVFISTKEPSVIVTILSIIFSLLLYSLIPFLLIRFYKAKNVYDLLNSKSIADSIVQKYPIPFLVLIALYLFYILIFHTLLLFRGIFPFWGKWLIELQGTIIITISILYFVALIVGTINFKLWAWWASFLYFILFTISLFSTLLASNVTHIISLLKLPSTEANALINIPLQGVHLSIILGIPLLLTLAVILYSRKYFLINRKSV